MTGRYEFGPSFGSELANALDQLYHLRILRLGYVALEPEVLIALSSLSSLKSLTLEEAGGFMVTPPEVSIPNNSFPSLQHLGMNPISIHGGSTRVWSMPAFVRRLTSVSVCMDMKAGQVDICEFVRVVFQCSPLVKELSLECPNSTTSLALLPPELISILVQLPLQRLCLMIKVKAYHNRSLLDSEQFTPSFATLECLQIHGYNFTFKDLFTSSLRSISIRSMFISLPRPILMRSCRSHATLFPTC
ncbi:hypothetical protein RSAG8_09465, partial [Rhizoctonia solani AG-8 WAC10335]